MTTRATISSLEMGRRSRRAMMVSTICRGSAAIVAADIGRLRFPFTSLWLEICTTEQFAVSRHISSNELLEVGLPEIGRFEAKGRKASTDRRLAHDLSQHLVETCRDCRRQPLWAPEPAPGGE